MEDKPLPFSFWDNPVPVNQHVAQQAAESSPDQEALERETWGPSFELVGTTYDKAMEMFLGQRGLADLRLLHTVEDVYQHAKYVHEYHNPPAVVPEKEVRRTARQESERLKLEWHKAVSQATTAKAQWDEYVKAKRLEYQQHKVDNGITR